MINQWSEQAFLRLYKSDNLISMDTRLMLATPSSSDPKNFVRPGIVVKVMSVDYPDDQQNPSAADEKPVLYFYVTKVVHEMSPEDKRAGTALIGSYVRFASDLDQIGVTEDDIDNGLKNPIYNSRGDYSQATASEA
jgi:hypothetical protein